MKKIVLKLSVFSLFFALLVALAAPVSASEADAGTQREMFETAARLVPGNRHERAEEAETRDQGRAPGRE